MDFIETNLQGACLIRMKRISDQRGFFARAWCTREFAEHGLNPQMAQMNVGFSPKAGTLRGLHYQTAPHQEAKLVRCTRGAIFDVVVDLRPGSATRGRWYGVELSADHETMLYAPEGFAHGYQTLRDDCEVCYLTSTAYAADAATGVRYNDPAFSISWPLPVEMISEADRNWPLVGRDAGTAA